MNLYHQLSAYHSALYLILFYCFIYSEHSEFTTKSVFFWIRLSKQSLFLSLLDDLHFFAIKSFAICAMQRHICFILSNNLLNLKLCQAYFYPQSEIAKQFLLEIFVIK